MLWLVVLLAISINYQHKQSLALAFLVGAGVLMPIPKEYGALFWYSSCVGVEFIILCVALTLNTKFSSTIASLSVLFIIVHLFGYYFDGYQPHSPYHYFAQTLEYTELASCVVLSNPIINYVKERIR
jgi:hypothetical protein